MIPIRGRPSTGVRPARPQVRASDIKVGKSSAKISLQLRAGLDGMEVDELVFQKALEPCDEDVTHPLAPTIHADAHFGFPQRTGRRLRRKLAGLIGVEDPRPAVAGKRLVQRHNAEASVHDVRQVPSPAPCESPSPKALLGRGSRAASGCRSRPHIRYGLATRSPAFAASTNRPGATGADRWCAAAGRSASAPSSSSAVEHGDSRSRV